MLFKLLIVQNKHSDNFVFLSKPPTTTFSCAALDPGETFLFLISYSMRKICFRITFKSWSFVCLLWSTYSKIIFQDSMLILRLSARLTIGEILFNQTTCQGLPQWITNRVKFGHHTKGSGGEAGIATPEQMVCGSSSVTEAPKFHHISPMISTISLKIQSKSHCQNIYSQSQKCCFKELSKRPEIRTKKILLKMTQNQIQTCESKHLPEV